MCRAIVIQCIKEGTNEKDVIEIGPSMVPDVIKLFEGDFAKMAAMLQAQNDRVVLMNPKLAQRSGPANPLEEEDRIANERESKTD